MPPAPRIATRQAALQRLPMRTAVASRSGFWARTNGAIYQTAHRLRALPALRARRLRRLLPITTTAPGPDDAPLPLLVLANGRLGDALLGAAFTARYRAWFGRPVVLVGRPETRCVVAPLVDRFVAFDPAADAGAATGLAATVRSVAGTYEAVLADLHLCHGGFDLLALLAALPAQHRLVYDGWIDRRLQAPHRPWPDGTDIVPGLIKTSGTDARGRHVWFDLLHYHRAVLDRLGSGGIGLPAAPGLPATALDGVRSAALALPSGYVACQPQSSQPKKDWPLHHFAAVFAALPEVPFVLLGGPRDQGHLPARSNVLDLRGRLDIATALAVVAGSRAFVGVDSAMAHAAALAGRPAVVAMPAATPGYFFPYPEGLVPRPPVAVWHHAFADCAGCGGICSREGLWRARRSGYRCLRQLGPEPVLAALDAALRAVDPAPAPKPVDRPTVLT